ncbi:hypothetical protein GCM10007874_23650 [Labrys miyagiensis]|uniref:DUF3072 domain-containing protein n=1 Tax=Labrys miyagiensis TaxID=346912 RepID=A0ABQ6CGD4_9HYPH|nr:hypothetical protein [Labrys miyagiensis]GLS19348.1 hypothetical protein GCM10007874_23650 [Labrys miyagiensis]
MMSFPPLGPDPSGAGSETRLTDDAPDMAAEALSSSADSDDAPMTEDQIGQLKALSVQINDPYAFSKSLTRGEAAARIKMLEAAIAR